MLVQNRRGLFTLFLAEPAALYITMSVTSKLLTRYFFFLVCHLEAASLWWPPPSSSHEHPFSAISVEISSIPITPFAAPSSVCLYVTLAGLCRQEGGLWGVSVLHPWEHGRQQDCQTQPCPGSPMLGVLQPPWKATSLVSEIVLWAPLLLSAHAQVPINF